MNDSFDLGDLPQSLVADVLKQTNNIEHELLQHFKEWQGEKEKWRKQLLDRGLLKRDTSLPDAEVPTTCGIDGSYAVERLLATDVVVAGAVAVEGFTPPSEQSHWELPRHRVYIESEVHNPDTNVILRAAMFGMELMLAEQAPHGLVLLDGSFTTPIIGFNQGFSKAKEYINLKIVKEYLINKIKPFLNAYYNILASQRNDRHWIAVPKYTTNTEIGKEVDWDESYEDKGRLSSILEAGEYTEPIKLQKPSSRWHIDTSVVNDFTTNAESNEIRELVESIRGFLNNIHVLYYRPREYMPALRVEMSPAIANNRHRLGIVLQGIKNQSGKAAMIEPYPLYMADRMVKHLPQALPACLHKITQYIAENYQGNIDDVFINLHSYRTESGR